MQRTRRRIDAALKSRIALAAVREQQSVADLARQYRLHPNQIYAWKKQLQNYAVCLFGRPTQIVAEVHATVRRRVIDADRPANVSADETETVG
jgi:transposase